MGANRYEPPSNDPSLTRVADVIDDIARQGSYAPSIAPNVSVAAGAVQRLAPRAGGQNVVIPTADGTNYNQEIRLLVESSLGPLRVRAVSGKINGAASITFNTTVAYVCILVSNGTSGWVTVDTNGGVGGSGAAGPAGPPGPPGSDGSDGRDGDVGPPGALGPAGSAGSNGANGTIGPPGPPGSDGADGNDGDPGPPGPQGIPGTNGTNGIGLPGPPGSDGADGNDGDPGPPGALGPAGSAGSNGANGTIGPPGPPSDGRASEDERNEMWMAGTWMTVLQAGRFSGQVNPNVIAGQYMQYGTDAGLPASGNIRSGTAARLELNAALGLDLFTTNASSSMNLQCGLSAQMTLTARDLDLNGSGGFVNIDSTTAMTLTSSGNDIILNATSAGQEVTVNANDGLRISTVTGRAFLVFEEEATSALGAAAGEGLLWVRNDTPNTIMYTDDTNIDHELLRGRLTRAPQYLTSGTAITHPDGTRYIRVRGWAGGGGGTGVAAATAANRRVGAGGGGGGYFERVYTLASLSSTYAIGAAGTGGPNTGAAAGAGGNTTFTHNAVVCTALGGNAAPANTVAGMAGTDGLTVTTSPPGDPSAISTGGDVNGAGTSGFPGYRWSGAAGQSGAGGMSPGLGGGGQGRTSQGNGVAGTARGSGGGGGLSAGVGAAVTGGAGVAGLIIVEEYS